MALISEALESLAAKGWYLCQPHPRAMPLAS